MKGKPQGGAQQTTIKYKYIMILVNTQLPIRTLITKRLDSIIIQNPQKQKTL